VKAEPSETIRSALRIVTGRIQPAGGTAVLITAAILGATTALAAVVFIRLIAATARALYVVGPAATALSGPGTWCRPRPANSRFRDGMAQPSFEAAVSIGRDESGSER